MTPVEKTHRMLPEEKAREKIDKQLIDAGWDVVSRDEYVYKSASAVKEALMKGNTESDYLLFVDGKAIAGMHWFAHTGSTRKSWSVTSRETRNNR